jgi:hypothetical protein
VQFALSHEWQDTYDIRRSKWYRNINHNVAKSIPEIGWNSMQYKLLGCSTGTANGDVSLCSLEVTPDLRNKVRTSGDIMLAFLLRITIPLYIGDALVNLHNGIALICDPSLPNAFILWDSFSIHLYTSVQCWRQ